jgi:putative transposase
VTWRQFLRAQA